MSDSVYHFFTITMDIKNLTQYGLVQDMLETINVIQKFNPQAIVDVCKQYLDTDWLILTGEGSSRIFPAKMMIHQAMLRWYHGQIITQWARQLMEYDIQDYTICALSNSGKTKEVINLLQHLTQLGHQHIIGVTAWHDTLLQQLSHVCHILWSGPEHACAASKTVIEQALVYDTILCHLCWQTPSYQDLANLFEQTLTSQIDDNIIKLCTQASVLYIAGRNDGVAEEISLKTNEITRKKSYYLEWTFAVHGVEETMNADELVILIDPYPSEEEKFDQVLRQWVGMQVVAIWHKQTRFPTIITPSHDRYSWYLQIASWWNLLTQIGLACDINIDQPSKARKVGNEYIANV